MGGYGSGRRGSGQGTTDSLLSLDIRYLRRAGFFQAPPGQVYSGSLAWSCRGQPSGDISVIVRGAETAYPPELELHYRTRARGETAWTEVDERIAIETTPCRYGGERPWFLCPRCFDRRAVLFSVDGVFRCRACHGLVYTSTRETDDDRVVRRALVIQKRLGGHTSGTIFDPEPKPRGMHWATYERLCDELYELNLQTMCSFIARFGKASDPLAALEGASLEELARLL